MSKAQYLEWARRMLTPKTVEVPTERVEAKVDELLGHLARVAVVNIKLTM